MDLCNPASSTPDGAMSPVSGGPTHAATGFYRTGTSLFYATEDGRVFLVSGPGEPVCLRPRAELPADAAPASYIRDPAHHLVADTAEGLARPMALRPRAEVGRDTRVIAAAFLQDLLASTSAAIGTLLLDEHPADPDELHDRVDDLLERSRAYRGKLSSQRVNRAGEAQNRLPPTSLPRSLVPFSHRGEYLGGFTSMRTAGDALGIVSIRDAHVRGELWTIVRGGLLHVFRCPPGESS
jgi:hypothetical protein